MIKCSLQCLIIFVLSSREIPTENIHKVAYIYSTYTNAIKLLVSRKAILPHVCPEYLLQYSDYLTYMKYIRPQIKEEPLSECFFRQHHIQNWLDVLLQTYKVFSLMRIKAPVQLTSQLSREPSQCSRTKNNSQGLMTLIEWRSTEKLLAQSCLQNVYSDDEVVLLTWLKCTFVKQRAKLWPDEEILEFKPLENFCNDLSDSLVLIAVTARYCPFLIPYFKDIHKTALTGEQKCHNAIRLLAAWEKMNLSFKINPTDIVYPVSLQMVMLVNHLYDVLPHLYPEQTLILEAPITQDVQKRIAIESKSESPVVYQITMFDNQKGYFSLESNVLKIPPKKSQIINLTYHARQLQRVSCTMVLTGDTQGYKYAKGMAFHIEGVPDHNYLSNELLIKSHLYDYKHAKLQFQSPYTQKADYHIYVVVSPRPEKVEDLKLIPYEEVKKFSVPRIIFDPHEKLSCDEDGLGVCHPVVNAVMPVDAEYYIYCVNKQVGTFVSKCRVLTSKERVHHEVVKANLTFTFYTSECTCDENEMNPKCPKTVRIKIPCKNNLLWRCMEESLVQVSEGTEQQFWRKYFGKFINVN